MAFTNLSQQGTSVPGSGGQAMVTKEMVADRVYSVDEKVFISDNCRDEE